MPISAQAAVSGSTDLDLARRHRGRQASDVALGEAAVVPAEQRLVDELGLADNPVGSRWRRIELEERLEPGPLDVVRAGRSATATAMWVAGEWDSSRTSSAKIASLLGKYV